MATWVPSPTLAFDRRQAALRDDDTSALHVAQERKNPAIDRDYEIHGHHPDCRCLQCIRDLA